MKLTFKPLIAEKNEKGEYTNVSLGRVSFWICFLSAFYIWMWGSGDIQASHLQMLYITATYNLMKKATWFGNISTPNAQVEIRHEAEEDEQPPRVP